MTISNQNIEIEYRAYMKNFKFMAGNSAHLEVSKLQRTLNALESQLQKLGQRTDKAKDLKMKIMETKRLIIWTLKGKP